MSVNVIDTKQKILKYISERGPSLPVHLTKVSDLNLTFTSAILSELLADKKLKLSNLRVGSSPLYLIPGQEEKLEAFISNLKDPEVEAFNKLKQNKILDDEKQGPVIRVALRSIRDFAIPLKHKDKLYWKYHLLPDEKASLAIGESDETAPAIGQERVIGQQIWEDIQKQQISKEHIEEIVKKQVEEITNRMKQETEIKVAVPIESPVKPPVKESKPIQIYEKPKFEDIEVAIKPSVEKKSKVVSKKPKKPAKKDLFVGEAKALLVSKGFEIIEVLKSDASKVIARARKEGELLVIVSGKKKVDEKELLRDLKKYSSLNLNVEIFSKGEPTKKMTEKIDLLSKIRDIHKIEEQ